MIFLVFFIPLFTIIYKTFSVSCSEGLAFFYAKWYNSPHMNNLNYLPIAGGGEWGDLLSWFGLTKDGVLDRFAALSARAVDRGTGDERFVYIPGARTDRVLLAAHADTRFDHLPAFPPPLQVADGIVRSADPAMGCGADDRAGCAILWALRDLGHSLLVTSCEEYGQKASHWLMEHNPDLAAEINDAHGFAVAFDRRNAADFKCYDVGTDAFRAYVAAMTGYTEPDRGSVTDIRVLCRDIPGANLSVGYHNEHTPAEYLDLAAWRHTLAVAREWLAPSGLPRFRRAASDVLSLAAGGA